MPNLIAHFGVVIPYILCYWEKTTTYIIDTLFIDRVVDEVQVQNLTKKENDQLLEYQVSDEMGK